MRPIEAARPMSLGFKVGSLGTLAPGLRPRVAGVEPEEADEDLILDDALFVVCFLSGESDSPKLSLSSMSGDATSMLPTIDETVGKVVAVVGSALQLPCETPDIAMTNPGLLVILAIFYWDNFSHTCGTARSFSA